MPELQWLTREADLRAANQVPYRLLEEVPALSATEQDPATENLLIQGDNLDALKALLPVYAGQVKCIFIDPPYNTRSAFGDFYEDNLEHSQWLSMMYPRLQLLREFLRDDGSIWITIDDNEAHYLKVVMDEIFGRSSFVTTIIWEKSDSPRNSARQFSSDHDYALVYSRLSEWEPRRLPRDEDSNAIYANPDNDALGPWIPGDPYANKPYSKGLYTTTGPSGRTFQPPPGRYWRISEETLRRFDAEGRIWWGPKGEARPSIKRYLSEVSDLVPRTIWKKDKVGSNRTSKNEMRGLFPGDASFATPKPEALVERALFISSNPGDLVLDSFLGSGTTAAVAHKMNRRYIGIEMGDHAVTHCAPRLRKVIGGEQGGISEAVAWQGGGGFRFYRLGPAIFNAEGEIDPAIRFPQLAAHLWFTETRTPRPRPQAMHKTQAAQDPCLGVYNGTAFYLLYNGILGDRRPRNGNVLTRAIVASLLPHDGPRVIYGESCRLSAATLARLNITFKQTPYDVRAR